MIDVDHKKLCEFCREHHERKEGWKCDIEEGWECDIACCNIMRRDYLKEHGITETLEPHKAKIFRNISTNDKIYEVTENQIIPKIKEYNILSVFKIIDGSLLIDTDNGRINISPANIDKSETLISFLLKSDCKKRLDDICTARIATLQKIIGTK
jgi:hypothetical protein